MEEFSDSRYITVIYGICRLFVVFFAFFIYSLCHNRRSHLPAFTYLQRFFLWIGIWDLVKALFYLLPDYNWLYAIPPLIYILTPFVNIAFFYFCFTYIFPKKINYIKYIKYLYILPFLMFLCIIITPLQRYFVTFTNQIIYIPHRDYQRIMHWGIYIFLGFFHIITITEIVFGFYHLRKKTCHNKLQTIIFLLILFLFFLQNISYNIMEKNLSLWFSLATSIFALFACYGIILTDPEEKIISAAQENLLEIMPFSIFILNSQDKILYANTCAQTICSNLQNLIDKPQYRKDVLEEFNQHESWRNKEFYSDSQNIILMEKKNNIPYYLHEQEFHARKKLEKQCKLMMMFTIEGMHTFFDDLETKAFKDALCGCYNRHFLTLKMGEFSSKKSDVKQFLPLSFVLGDVDGLKRVNDTLGHTVGDNYLLLCYNAMKESTRKKDYIFRLGGDEFLIILPHADASIAQEITQRIEGKISHLKHKVAYNPRISLGSYTVETLPVDVNQCIKLADEAMYKIKQQRKQIKD